MVDNFVLVWNNLVVRSVLSKFYAIDDSCNPFYGAKLAWVDLQRATWIKFLDFHGGFRVGEGGDEEQRWGNASYEIVESATKR